MKLLKKSALVLATTLLATSVFAAKFKGNWTEKFELKDGHYAEHTPTYVSFDGWMKGGTGIHIDSVINGTKISNLHLETDSTREEFIAALKRSNMYKG